MITVVCDTNIYISSLISTAGPPDEVLALGRMGKITIAISQPIVSEIKNVLQYKLLVEKDVIGGIVEELHRFTLTVEPKESVCIIKTREADNRIIECALEAKAQFIVSGDKKHLLPLKRFEGIWIVSPVEFLKAMNSGRM